MKKTKKKIGDFGNWIVEEPGEGIEWLARTRGGYILGTNQEGR